MTMLERPDWQEQLGQFKEHVRKADAKVEEQPPSPVPAHPLKPVPQKPATPQDSIEVINGKMTVKSPAGDVVVPLSKEAQNEFLQKALKYQQVIINEKKANVFATYAMAALSGLSALAIGVTLARGSLLKRDFG